MWNMISQAAARESFRGEKRNLSGSIPVSTIVARAGSC
jgi:hypothetical protein